MIEVMVMLVTVYPWHLFTVALWNWMMGYWIGTAIMNKRLIRKLNAMTERCMTARQAATTWQDEVTQLAASSSSPPTISTVRSSDAKTFNQGYLDREKNDGQR